MADNLSVESKKKIIKEELKKRDIEFVLENLRKPNFDSEIIEEKLEKYSNDRDVMLQLVSEYGCALKWASYELKKDKGLVIEAVKNDYLALNYVDDPELLEDREFMLELIKINPDVFDYVSTKLLSDKELMLEMLKEDIGYFSCFSAELRDDKSVVMELIKNEYYDDSEKWEVIKDDCCEMLEDRDVLKYFFEAGLVAFDDLPEDLQNDSEFIEFEYERIKEEKEEAKKEEEKRVKEIDKILEYGRKRQEEYDMEQQRRKKRDKILNILAVPMLLAIIALIIFIFVILGSV